MTAPTGGAIRREATKAASEISFKFAFQFIVTEMIVLGNTASPGAIPKRLGHLRGGSGSGVHNKTRPTIKAEGG